MNCFGNISEKTDCPERYKDTVFDNFTVEKDIQYGTALGYYTSKPSDYISKDGYRHWFNEMFNLSVENRGFMFKNSMKQLPLLLDVYQPENDPVKKRPLVLYIHGGAFFFGDKENKSQQVLTDYVVKRGFMVASINYRLGTSITPGSIERAIYRDVQDARAALRYLVHHKEKYGIDVDQIYLAGNSAGGIISLKTAFMGSDDVYSSAGRGLFNRRENLGSLDDSGNNLTDSFKIAGVVSMWGGVTNLQMLNNHIPTLLFHGTADNVIPCTEGLPFKEAMGDRIYRFLSSFGKIYGSEMIHDHLKSINVPVTYIPFENAGHDPQIEPDDSLNEIINLICYDMGDFLYYNVVKHYFNHNLSGNTTVSKSDFTPLYQLDNLENSKVNWHVEGGFIISQTNSSIRVVWCSSHDTGTVTACITDANGVSHRKELNVKIKM